MTGLHADALRALRAWSPPDADQTGLREEFLTHLAAQPEGLWRSCTPAHMTASALVVDAQAGRVLLTLHPKVGRWLQTGGHCEATDLTLAGAALREAAEESGVDGLRLSSSPVALDRHEVPCGGPGTRYLHLDVQYVAWASAGCVERRSKESLDLRWFPIDALPTPTDPALARLVERACAPTEPADTTAPGRHGRHDRRIPDLLDPPAHSSSTSERESPPAAATPSR